MQKSLIIQVDESKTKRRLCLFWEPVTGLHCVAAAVQIGSEYGSIAAANRRVCVNKQKRCLFLTARARYARRCVVE